MRTVQSFNIKTIGIRGSKRCLLYTSMCIRDRVNFTDVFDYIAWLFYPLTKLTMIPDEMAVAQAAAITVAEPVTSMVVASSAASIVSRFVVGVLAIGEIVFFTGTIPCILPSNIDVSLGKLFIIWIERVVCICLLYTSRCV